MKNKNILILLFISIIAAAFFFIRLQTDFDGEIWNIGNSFLVVDQAIKQHIPVRQIIASLSEKWQGDTGYLGVTAFGNPLSLLITLLLYHFTNSMPISIALFCSLSGFLSVLLTYVFGAIIYNRKVGFLAAILLAATPFFIINERSGWVFYSIIPLLVLLFHITFYLAHQRRKNWLLFLSGLASCLIFFNGWPAIVTLMFTVLIFLLFGINFIKRRTPAGLLGSIHYVLWFFIYAITGIILTIGFSQFLNENKFVTLNQIYAGWFTTKLEYVSHLFSAFKNSTAFETYLLKLYHNLTYMLHYTLLGIQDIGTNWPWAQNNPVGVPLLEPFIAIFFLIGCFTLFKKRALLNNRYILAILITMILSLTILGPFKIRYTLQWAPFVFITMALGISNFWSEVLPKITGKYRWAINLEKIFKIAIVILIIHYIVLGYYNYFIRYVGKNWNIIYYYGHSEAVSFILKSPEAENSLVVLPSNQINTPYEAIHFYSSGRLTNFRYYSSDLEQELIRKNLSLTQWEKIVLDSQKAIFYIFSTGNYFYDNPGWKFFSASDKKWFKEAHPGKLPDKVISDFQGIPILEVYKITKEDLNSRVYQFLQYPEHTYKFTLQNHFSGPSMLVNDLEFRGKSHNLVFYTERSSLLMPIITYPGTRVEIDYSPQSKVIFRPLIEGEDYKNDIFDMENICLYRHIEQPKSYLAGGVGRSFLIYHIEAPNEISRLTLKTNFRLFNDPQRKNSIGVWFSDKPAGNYSKIFEIKSNGNRSFSVYQTFDLLKGWIPYQQGFNAGVYEREGFHVIYPNSKAVFIKFIFECNSPGACQIWSTPDHETSFVAEFDSSSLQRLTINDNDILWVNNMKPLEFLIAVGPLPSGNPVPVASKTILFVKRFEAERFSYGIQNVVNDEQAENKEALMARQGIDAPTLMLTGPSRPFLSGSYIAAFKLKVSNNQVSDEIAVLDVQYDSPEQKPIELSLKGTDFVQSNAYQTFILPFDTSGKSNIQLRIMWRGNVDLWADYIEVREQ